MTKREASLARVFLLVGGLVGVFFVGYVFIWAPLQAAEQQLNELSLQIGQKNTELLTLMKQRQQVERWRQLSLPADINLAEREYSRYLGELFSKAKINPENLTPIKRPASLSSNAPGAAKKPVFTPISFRISARTHLENVAKLLRDFQRTPLDQKIKTFKLEPAERESSGKKGKDKGKSSDLPLNLSIEVEALIIDRAERVQPNLLGPDERLVALEMLNGLRGGPVSPALVLWAAGPRGPIGVQQTVLAGPKPPRHYEDIARRNIFTGARPAGPRPVDDYDKYIAKLIYLPLISSSDDKTRAYLIDRANNNVIQTLEVGKEFILYRRKDPNGKETLLRGTVLRIDPPRELYFRVQDQVYRMEVGSNLADAMSTPVEGRKARELLTAARAAPWR